MPNSHHLSCNVPNCRYFGFNTVGIIYLIKQLVNLGSYGVLQNETVKQVKAETQLKQAQTALAWEKVNTQIEITDQLRLAKQFHDVTVGTFVVSSDEAKFYPKPQKFDFSELSKEELIDLVEFSKAVIEIDQKRNDELVRKITEQQHFITQLETRLSEVAK